MLSDSARALACALAGFFCLLPQVMQLLYLLSCCFSSRSASLPAQLACSNSIWVTWSGLCNPINLSASCPYWAVCYAAHSTYPPILLISICKSPYITTLLLIVLVWLLLFCQNSSDGFGQTWWETCQCLIQFTNILTEQYWLEISLNILF